MANPGVVPGLQPLRAIYQNGLTTVSSSSSTRATAAAPTIVHPLMLSSESEIIHIDYRMDPTSMKNIVLWEDILLAFEDAVHVRHNSRVLPFLRGSNFQVLEPFRIEAMPDVVLNVVLRDPLSRQETNRTLSASTTPSSVLPRETLPTVTAPRTSTTRAETRETWATRDTQTTRTTPSPLVASTATPVVAATPGVTAAQLQNSLRTAFTLLDDNDDDEDDNAPPPDYQEAIANDPVIYSTTSSTAEAPSRIFGHRLPSSSTAVPFLSPPAYSTPSRTITNRTTNINNNNNNALARATAVAATVTPIASRYSATTVSPFMRPSEYTQHLRNTIGTSNTTTNTNNNSNNALATATATADAVRSTASRYSATAVGPFMRPSEYTQHLRNTIGTSNTTTNTNNNINNVLATATATADAARPTASRYSATAAGSPMRPSEYMHNARNTIRTINTATNTATNTNNTLDVGHDWPDFFINRTTTTDANNITSTTTTIGTGRGQRTITATTNAGMTLLQSRPLTDFRTSSANTTTTPGSTNNSNNDSANTRATDRGANYINVQNWLNHRSAYSPNVTSAATTTATATTTTTATITGQRGCGRVFTPDRSTLTSPPPLNPRINSFTVTPVPPTASPTVDATTTTVPVTNTTSTIATATTTTATTNPSTGPRTPKLNIEDLIARAKGGDKESRFQIAAIYRDGTHGVTQDYFMATKWFLALAKSSVPSVRAEAQFAIAAMYESGGVSGVVSGVDVDEDSRTGDGARGWRIGQVQQTGTPEYKNARGWYLKAATVPLSAEWTEGAYKGHAGAQFKVGEFYWKGIGGSDSNTITATTTASTVTTSRDTLKALEWFRKAAIQGHVQAQWNIGMLYLEGEDQVKGVKKDLQRALVWFVQAGEQGCADAQWQAGRLYIQGKGGVRVEREKAVEWWRKAAVSGHLEAMQELLERGVSVS